jgi:hypothetical protein
MSIGHRHAGLDDSPISESDFSKLKARHPEIVRDAEGDDFTVSHAYDMLYLCGYSITGRRGFVSRDIPLIAALKKRRSLTPVKVKIVKYPMRHERYESACIRYLNMDYAKSPGAHHVAVRAEMDLVLADDLDWDSYEEWWAGHMTLYKDVKAGRKSADSLRIPADFDYTPFAEDQTPFDKTVIPGLQKAARRSRSADHLFKTSINERRKESHEESGYIDEGTPEKHCGICSMFLPPDACSAVKKPISERALCDLFELDKRKVKARAV